MIYVSMILFAATALFANHQATSREEKWGRPVALVCGAMALILALIKVVSNSSVSEQERDEFVERELSYKRAAMEFIGDYLAIKYPGSRVLVITESAAKTDAGINGLLLESLEIGLNGKLKIAATVSPQPGAFVASNAKKPPPDEDMAFDAEYIDVAHKLNPQCDVILSLTGIPGNWKRLKIFSLEPEKRPKIIAAFTNIYELKQALQLGFVTAAITVRKGYTFSPDQRVPKNFTKAFEQRYVLIDKENVAHYEAANPGSFSKVVDKVEEEEGEE